MPTLFERILVPLDGSPQAESILYQAQKLLCGRKSEVILFHAADPASSPNPEALGKYLKGVGNRLTPFGATVKQVTRTGPMETALSETIATENISLVALSSHGQRTAPGTPVAGTVELLARTSPIPVLVSRAFQPGDDGQPVPARCEPSNIRRILVPFGSGAGDAALPYAEELARLWDARIIVLRLDPALPEGAMETPAADPAANQLSSAGLETTALAVGGDWLSAILGFGRPSAADLIALSGDARITDGVLKDSLLPTLLVR